MNIVDSSGWLEYFANGKNASYYEPVITSVDDLLVPTITLYEVFKKVLRHRDETQALIAIAIMQQGMVVDLSNSIAINAAKISYELKVPMADSIIMATARQYSATIWTQDNDFENLEGVKYIER